MAANWSSGWASAPRRSPGDGSYIDNFDGRVGAQGDEVTGTLDQRLVNTSFQRSADFDSAATHQALERVRRYDACARHGYRQDPGRRRQGSGRRARQAHRGDHQHDQHARPPCGDDRHQDSEIDRTLGNRALEVAGTLDNRIAKFEELLVGRAEKLAEEVETRTRAAAGALDTSNDAIRNSTENLERMLMTVSAGVGEAAQAECRRGREDPARRQHQCERGAAAERQRRGTHPARRQRRGGAHASSARPTRSPPPSPSARPK